MHAASTIRFSKRAFQAIIVARLNVC